MVITYLELLKTTFKRFVGENTSKPPKQLVRFKKSRFAWELSSAQLQYFSTKSVSSPNTSLNLVSGSVSARSWMSW